MNAIWKLVVATLLLVGTLAASAPIVTEPETVTVPKAELAALISLMEEQDAVLRLGTAKLQEAFAANRQLAKEVDVLEKKLRDLKIGIGCS